MDDQLVLQNQNYIPEQNMQHLLHLKQKYKYKRNKRKFFFNLDLENNPYDISNQLKQFPVFEYSLIQYLTKLI